MKKRIPMSSPELNDADIQTVNEVLQTRYLSLGPTSGQPWAAALY
mgnify:CR=1 FL=1